MSTFDPYIKKIAEYVKEMKAEGRRTREFQCPKDARAVLQELPIKVGPRANPGIIFREDTFVELGNPADGSCGLLLWTDNPSLIKKGHITLIGSDIQEGEGARLPFGQILMIGGKALEGGDQDKLEQRQHISDQIEGYMIRSTPRHMWCRVSHEAVAKGFSFDMLGRALIASFMVAFQKIEAVEVVFVTSSKDDVQRLDGLAEQTRNINRQMKKEIWKAKGYDVECLFGWGCGDCPEKPVCDDIREVVNIRKEKNLKRT